MSARSTALRALPNQQPRLDLDSFARAANLHPDLVRRFVNLGLLEGTHDATGELWLLVSQLAAASRIQRLRAGFGMNYAALGLVVDLLDRVDRLEAALNARVAGTPADRSGTSRPGGTTWT
jgi:chaperone modulatory protein CbpM